MSRTESIYYYSSLFQKARRAILAEYNETIRKIEKSRGTPFFTEREKKAAAARDEKLLAAKNDYRRKVDPVITEMRKINGQRTIKTPTEDELKLLQLLNMRVRVTERECEDAAVALKGNPACLAALDEIAQRSGVKRSYMGYTEDKEMPKNAVDRIISALQEGINDFVENDTSRTSRMVKSFRQANYGAEGYTLQPRPEYDSTEVCFSDLCRLAGDDLAAFSNVVDK